MVRCKSCKYFFRDWSVGAFGCSDTDKLTDEEYEAYNDNGFVDECEHYSFDESILTDDTMLDFDINE